MDKKPFCSIIIPSLNEELNIEECLKSLDQQSYPRDRYELVVVDNGSTDNTVDIAKKFADKVLSKEYSHVGGVRNFGVIQTSGDILISTDADCFVEDNWLQQGVELLQNNNKSVYGGGLKPRKSPVWIERFWLLNDDGNSIQQHDLMGSCIFCWRDDFLKIGMFKEDVTSGEDSDLSKRFKEEGYTVELNGKLSLVHFGTPQTAMSFMQRQVWHAENYITDFKSSYKDKVFWITAGYILSIIAIIISLLFQNSVVSFFLLASNQTLPSLLSMKRISRTKQKIKDPISILKVLTLDNLYLTGRAVGLLKGIYKELFK